MSLPQRMIGTVSVSAIGLGGMPISVEGRPDEARALRTIHAALDAGVTFIDSANAYHQASDAVGHDETGHNESLIAKALATWGGDASQVLVATKGGHLRTSDGTWVLNGRPEHIKQAAQESAARLGVEVIGLYQYHRPDPDVPYAETIGAFADLLDQGLIQMAGISNANPEQIRLANDILGGRLAAVQNQFSPGYRVSLPELELCAAMSIAFMPWKPLGGSRHAQELGAQFPAFARVAEARGVSAQQVALAWELSLAPTVIPIPGATRPESILDALAALELHLTTEEQESLNAEGS
jgi:aryl-alcohol dehydrogenase-like predicted oxidoreductase